MRNFMAYSVHQLEWLDTHAASGKAEPLKGVGEGLLVDLRILGAEDCGWRGKWWRRIQYSLETPVKAVDLMGSGTRPSTSILLVSMLSRKCQYYESIN